MQSRAEVVPLRQGDAVVFAVHHRPVQGTRGIYRVNLRHGVSRVRSGTAPHARRHLPRRGLKCDVGMRERWTCSTTSPRRRTGSVEPLADGAVLLRGFAQRGRGRCWREIGRVVAAAPFRHMVTPGGHRMSVAMTNCGSWAGSPIGAATATTAIDPESGAPGRRCRQPARRARPRAAAAAGFDGFAPDACLVNRYEPGARLTLHQDRDERDFGRRSSRCRSACRRCSCSAAEAHRRPRRVPLAHGDVVVWGGPSRLRFHGVLPLVDGWHPLTGVPCERDVSAGFGLMQVCSTACNVVQACRSRFNLAQRCAVVRRRIECGSRTVRIRVGYGSDANRSWAMLCPQGAPVRRLGSAFPSAPHRLADAPIVLRLDGADK